MSSEQISHHQPSAFQPIARKKRLYEDVMEQVQKLIESGQFRPGDRLPAERDLAERLGVNRASIRQALHALSLLRTVDIRPGEGAFVRDTEKEGSIEAFLLGVMSDEGMDPSLIAEALEARRLLEVPLAGWAAERATPEDIAHLKEIYSRMEAAFKKDDPAYISLDWEFHLAVDRMSGRRLLSRLLNTFYSMFKGKLYPFFVEMGKHHFSLDEHRAIIRAIEAHDPAAARRAVSRHLTGVEDFLESDKQDEN